MELFKKREEDEHEGTYREIKRINDKMRKYGKHVNNMIWGFEER